MPWYAAERDLPDPGFLDLRLYRDLEDLASHADEIGGADAVLVGSYVPEGVAAGEWALRAARGPVLFYDIDTPVTLAKLAAGDEEYLSPALIPRYAAYLSFAGGPTLERLEREYGSPRALPLYCCVDPEAYAPVCADPTVDLTYMGTYSPDRQPPLERLLIEPARRRPDLAFHVAGPSFPTETLWPPNVRRTEHLPPAEHRAFYGSGRFTLNVTRAAMVVAGYSPSVRLFEAAACGVPIVTDRWAGLESAFAPDEEILVADMTEDALSHLALSDSRRGEIAGAARARVLRDHTSGRRAEELEDALQDASLRNRVGAST